mgnify:CR=1 FL=1
MLFVNKIIETCEDVLRLEDTISQQLPDVKTLVDFKADAKKLTGIQKQMRLAAKFNLGFISDVDYENQQRRGGALAGTPGARFPYPFCYFEIKRPGDANSTLYLLVRRTTLEEAKAASYTGEVASSMRAALERGTAYEYILFSKRGEVVPVSIFVFFPLTGDNEKILIGLTFFSSGNDIPKKDVEAVGYSLFAAGFVALGLLNDPEFIFEDETPSPKLNLKRARRGKEPLYEHKVLRIAPTLQERTTPDLGGTHASPRSHWRRGHTRTLRRGTDREKMVFVKHCLINEDGHGFVSKDYEMAK